MSASRKITPDQPNIPIEDLDAALAWLLACRPKTTAIANWLPKASKQSVHYGVGHYSSHCGKSFDDDRGYCKHFIPPLSPANNLGQCRLVSGPINKVYRCQLWQRAHSK